MGSPVSSPVRRSCRGMDICDPRIEQHSPGMAQVPRTPVNQRSASGVGATIPYGRCQRGGSLFWKDLLPDDGAISPPGWHWRHEPQPISEQPVGLGFHTVRGGIDPEDHRFRPRIAGVVDICKDLWSGDGPISSPSAAGSTNSGQSAITLVSTQCGAVSTPEITVFVPD